MKTIGDGYMVASGVPDERADHAIAAVNASRSVFIDCGDGATCLLMLSCSHWLLIDRAYLAAMHNYNELCGTNFQV